MEVVITIDDESVPASQTMSFGKLTEFMTVYDLKKKIEDKRGYPID